ncbi:exported hypothetical protein [Parafrankia sp. Ea1.12]|nr:exported hypothetical protein [Parafrankia sp. Ea1.12]
MNVLAPLGTFVLKAPNGLAALCPKYATASPSADQARHLPSRSPPPRQHTGSSRSDSRAVAPVGIFQHRAIPVSILFGQILAFRGHGPQRARRGRRRDQITLATMAIRGIDSQFTVRV